MSAHDASTGSTGIPDTHGAVDLGALTNAGDGSASPRNSDSAARRALIIDLDEQNFGESVQRSTRTPLLLTLVSGTGQDQTLVDTLTELVIGLNGRLLLGVVDAGRHPQIAQALQVRALPTTLALIAGQPVPLFEGLADRSQIEPVLDQVLQVAAQQGATEVVEVPQEQAAPAAEPTLTPQQLAGQQALDDGRLEEAAAAFQGILNEFPKDEFARHGLLLAHLRQRVGQAETRRSEPSESGADVSQRPATSASLEHVLDEADRAWLAGSPEKAFELLLQPGLWADAEDRAPLQKRLIELFDLTGNADPAVNAARTRLASLLF